VLNFLGTTFLLLGVGLLYGTVGTLNMADILRLAPEADPAVIAAIGAVILLAFGIKAAAFPVNGWLPASYHAPPAPIAALLVGLATKVGAYALLRTTIAILPAVRDVLEPVIALVAVATLVLAPLGAIAETNLRRALGFIVIGGIGATLAGLAIGTEAGAAGAIAYIAHAMLTMAALYLVAGLIETVTGQSDWRQMADLYRSAPWLAVLFFVLILAAAGVPPFLGFWPKFMLLEAVLAPQVAGAGWLVPVLAGALVLNAFLTLVAGTRLWSHIFWRPTIEAADEIAVPARPRHTAAFAGPLAAGALTALVVAIGLWPSPLLDASASAAAGLFDTTRYLEIVDPGASP
jgi:multicomponent Na+:H+ antiporter subunit D